MYISINCIVDNSIVSSSKKLGVCIDTRTTKAFIKRHSLELSVGQSIDESRRKACSCPLMSYMWYLIVCVYSGTLPPCCKWNADASTFVFDPSLRLSNKTVRLCKEEEYYFLDNDDLVVKRVQKGKQKSKGSRLPYAIKVMQMISAAGDNSPFVAILTIKDMSPEEWWVEEVPGLSLSNHLGSVGCIYFSKTRCGNKEMWKDYFRRIVVPTIRASNEAYDTHDENDYSRTFFSTDGEDIIISRAYEDDVRDLLNAENIWYGRVGAGTTGIHNACDRQLTFRETKKETRKALKNNLEMSNFFSSWQYYQGISEVYEQVCPRGFQTPA